MLTSLLLNRNTDVPVEHYFRSGCVSFCPIKGRTIRKVMGGVGDFQSAGIFFYAQCLCRNFFFS